jgi:transcriptional regulator with XRE-family HTH domain
MYAHELSRPNSTAVSNDARDQELSNKIGQRIRDRRKQMGLSQAALADQVDLAQQAVYKIEHGLSTPGIHRLAAIATALNLPLGELVDGNSKAKRLPIAASSLTTIEAELLSAFRLLPDIQGKRALLQVARRMCNPSPREPRSQQLKP